MCCTVGVYGWLSQLRWVLQRLGHILVEELPREGHRWLVRCHVPVRSHDSGVASLICSPVGVLETHDDGEGDGLVLAGLRRSRGDGDARDDGLRVVWGVDRGLNIWRYGYACVTGERSVGVNVRLRARRILEEKEKSDTF